MIQIIGPEGIQYYKDKKEKVYILSYPILWLTRFMKYWKKHNSYNKFSPFFHSQRNNKSYIISTNNTIQYQHWYDFTCTVPVFFHSQSTEDSLDVKETLYSQEPIYDKPFTHHQPSDSEHEWPYSTTPPPRPTSPPNGELPSRDQLVKPSMLRKNRGSNAGNCLTPLLFHTWGLFEVLLSEDFL